MIFILLSLILIFLCWGSFLNVIAVRLVNQIPFFTKRSMCPFCNQIIVWYDNIPILSWILLKSKCRFCKKYISILYPFIEILTSILMTFLFLKIFYFNNCFIFEESNILYFVSYFIFFTALIVAVRTDMQALVIPQIFSLWLIPFGLGFSFFNFIYISFSNSLVGAILGYGSLWLTAIIFKKITKKEGLGVGDMELLGMIGSFLGIIGVWVTLLIGSLSGLMIGLSYILITKQNKFTKIPFGPFLVFGAIIYFFFKSFFVRFLLG